MTTSHRDEPVWFGTTDPNRYADQVGVAVCPDPDTLTAIQITVGVADGGEQLTTSLTIADAEQLAAALPELIEHARQRLLAQLHTQHQASTDQYQAKLSQLQPPSADLTNPPPPHPPWASGSHP
jgi:hypothetical protein